jgi:hypothetical protein
MKYSDTAFQFLKEKFNVIGVPDRYSYLPADRMAK